MFDILNSRVDQSTVYNTYRISLKMNKIECRPIISYQIVTTKLYMK